MLRSSSEASIMMLEIFHFFCEKANSKLLMYESIVEYNSSSDIFEFQNILMADSGQFKKNPE